MLIEGKTIEPLIADSESTQSNEPLATSQDSLAELNSVLLIVMAGLAAFFTAALFVVSHA